MEYKWIVEPKTEPEIFINGFVSHIVEPVLYNDQVLTDTLECIRRHFRSGYCWHFANILKTTFNRGEICWAAPYNHFVWKDIDGICYDIEGKYEEHINGDVFYYIPEKYMGEYINSFKHISLESDMFYEIISKSQLLSFIKEYCKDMGMDYDTRIEDYYVDHDIRTPITDMFYEYEISGNLPDC